MDDIEYKPGDMVIFIEDFTKSMRKGDVREVHHFDDRGGYNGGVIWFDEDRDYGTYASYVKLVSTELDSWRWSNGEETKMKDMSADNLKRAISDLTNGQDRYNQASKIVSLERELQERKQHARRTI